MSNPDNKRSVASALVPQTLLSYQTAGRALHPAAQARVAAAGSIDPDAPLAAGGGGGNGLSGAVARRAAASAAIMAGEETTFRRSSERYRLARATAGQALAPPS